tara:strand:+ start:589 stop:756 length:168 start_codon:yes stop_codon:yes gene_type:complete
MTRKRRKTTPRKKERKNKKRVSCGVGCVIHLDGYTVNKKCPFCKNPCGNSWCPYY